jgi:hypothetical protein
VSDGIDLRTLNRLLDADETLRDLRRYFDDTEALGERFTGRRFESLAGGGDHVDVAHRITGDDLVAVTTLSVAVPAEAAIGLLDGQLGHQLAALLPLIPTDLPLAEPAATQHIAEGSPGDRAWHLLTGTDGIGWVTASKILARKRPHLLPVYDQVVRCVLGGPDSFWQRLHLALRADGAALDGRLDDLVSAAGLGQRVSNIRALDVVLWMRHHQAHLATGCPGVAVD